jgi:hypothetical protein
MKEALRIIRITNGPNDSHAADMEAYISLVASSNPNPNPNPNPLVSEK